MRILKSQMMRENELSIVGKALVTGIVILLFAGAAIRLGRGEVRYPGSLWIVALGLILFLIAKLSVIFRGKWIKATAETAQVTGITPGSTKPAVAPSKEEILAGVAAQIAAAQSTDAGGARPKFAVASVRPVPMSPLVANGFKCLGVDGLWGHLGGPQVSTAQGRCTGDVVNLPELVYLA